MENYIKRGNLNIHNALDRFLSDEMLSGLDLTSDEFWKKFEGLLEEFHQRNKDLLAKRSLLQDQISTWHKNNDFNINENLAKRFTEIESELIKEKAYSNILKSEKENLEGRSS